MKKFLITPVLFLSCLFGESQNFETGNYKMFGLNSTSFVKNFLSFNEINPNTTDAFEFTFRNIGPNNAGFRANLGLLYNSSVQQVNNSKDGSTMSFLDLQMGLGYEIRKPINRRWLYYYGMDGLLGYEQRVKDNSNAINAFTSVQSSVSFGASPFVGLQFNLNERISISTEAGLPFKYTMTTNKTATEGSNSSNRTNTMRLQSAMPRFVYINFIL